jgi:hypothetical protein
METYVLLPSINVLKTEVYLVPLDVFLEKVDYGYTVVKDLVQFMIPFATLQYFGKQGDAVLESFGLTNWTNERFEEVVLTERTYKYLALETA